MEREADLEEEFDEREYATAEAREELEEEIAAEKNVGTLADRGVSIIDQENIPPPAFQQNIYSLQDHIATKIVYEENFRFSLTQYWTTDAASYVGSDTVLFQDLSPTYRFNILERDDNTISRVKMEVRGSKVAVDIHGRTAHDVRMKLMKYRVLFKPPRAVSNDIFMNFWNITGQGPRPTNRKLTVPTWDTVKNNYHGGTYQSINDLMGQKPDYFADAGKFVLWHGVPGTGKTYALRSLAHNWRGWANFEYVVDPDAFFSGSSEYMMSILMGDSSDNEKWRVLVFEDTGELLSANARQTVGQGLSRFLNVVDGLIGQGLNIICLVTTNEEIEKMHPAVIRPGRCASLIRFEPLSQSEASEWAKLKGFELDTTFKTTFTLAELYSESAGRKVAAAKSKPVMGFRPVTA